MPSRASRYVVPLRRRKISPLFLSLALLLTGTRSASGQSEPNWTSGNGPFSGEVLCVAPGLGGTIHIGTASGVYRSVDSGYTWGEVAPELRDSAVVAVASVPGKCVVAGTRTGVVYRSTDDGSSWTRGDSLQGPLLTLYAARDGSLLAGWTGGILRSSDSGATWKTLSALGRVFSIAESPTGVLYAGGYGQFHHSTDNGASWQSDSMARPEENITALAFGDNGEIFAIIRNLPEINVCRSGDGGKSWTRIDPSIWRTQSVYAGPGGLLLAGTEDGVARSTDYGRSWEPGLYQPIDVFDPRGIIRLPSGTMLVISVDGVFRSTDEGRNWIVSSEGLDGGFCNDIAIGSEGEIYVEAGWSIFRSSDLGATWRRTPIREYTFAMETLPNGSLLIATEYGMFLVPDRGEDWDLDTYVGAGNYQGVARSPIGDLFGVTYSGGVRRSTDGGETWSGLGLGSGTGTHLFASRTGDLFANHSGQIDRSTNRGETWRQLRLGLPYFYELLIRETPDGDLLISHPSLGPYLVLRDGWSVRSIGPQIKDATDMIMTVEGSLFVSSLSMGVWRSNDTGRTWSDWSSGLPVPGVRALALHPSGYLFAATSGGSVVRSRTPVGTFSSVEMPARRRGGLEAELLEVSGQRALVRVSSDRSVSPHLTLYDVMGRPVAGLDATASRNGEQLLSVSLGDIAEGIYFMVVESGQGRVVLRVPVVR